MQVDADARLEEWLNNQVNGVCRLLGLDKSYLSSVNPKECRNKLVSHAVSCFNILQGQKHCS